MRLLFRLIERIEPQAGFEEILPIFQTIDTVFVFIFLAELLLFDDSCDA